MPVSVDLVVSKVRERIAVRPVLWELLAQKYVGPNLFREVVVIQAQRAGDLESLATCLLAEYGYLLAACVTANARKGAGLPLPKIGTFVDSVVL